MSDKPMPLTVLGRNIGTYTGWDSIDTITFYDFKPIDGITIPACGCLNIMYDTGRWEAYTTTGLDAFTAGDLLTTLRDIPPIP